MRPGCARAMLDHGETRVPNHCVTADMDDTGAVSHSGRHPSRRAWCVCGHVRHGRHRCRLTFRQTSISQALCHITPCHDLSYPEGAGT